VSQAVDTSATETKGTVLIESAEQLETYAHSEEKKMEVCVSMTRDPLTHHPTQLHS
jgi:T-complex protein 1 subunit theta